jgi:predicted nucleic acid-binding protein
LKSLIVAEPPAAYVERPRLVVDASVLACALFGEAGSDAAFSWMRGRTLCAPHLVDCEIAHVALAKVRRGGVDESAAMKAIHMLASTELERHAVDPVDVFALASRTRLSAYDAAYLWLARALQVPLATFDEQLGKAAVQVLRDRGA